MSTPLVDPTNPPAIATAPVTPGATVTVIEPKAPVADPSEARFTAAQIEAARREEKDKLYGRLEADRTRVAAMETELATLRAEREERAAAEAAKAAEDGDAAKAKREGDMSAKKLLEERSQEWEERFAKIQEERTLERAALAKEAEFAELRAYVHEALATERAHIAPELVDLVRGDTREEIDASIATLKTKTEAILASVQAAQQTLRSQQRGVSTAGYTTAGPLDNESGSRQLTPADIKNMSMPEYAKYRTQLLGAASAKSNKARGLFD